MKRDKLEDLLHDKLNHIEMEPPKDMWSKLESGLAATGLATGVESQLGAQPSQNVAGKASTKLKNAAKSSAKSQTKWMYAAASIVFTAILIGGLTLFNDKQEVAKVETEQIEVAPSQTHEPAIPAEEVVKAIEAQTQPSYLYVVSNLDDLEKVEPNIERPYEEPFEGIALSEPEPEEAEPNNDKTSDMKRDKFAVATPDKAEFIKRKKRRTNPLALSVFAANFGAKSASEQSKGGAVMTNTGFAVNEAVSMTTDMNSIKSHRNTNVERYRHKLPLTFGLSVAIGLTDRLSIQTGLSYTYMQSEADIQGSGGAENPFDYSLKQKLHYLGIPVSVKYDILSGKRLSLYASAGGAIERAISAKATSHTISEGGGHNTPSSEKLPIKGVQMSVGANLGLEVKIDRILGIYVEPGFGYYFKNSNQLPSYRTEHPLNFTLKAGVRIHF